MCWTCDHPGATTNDYLTHVQQVINRSGWLLHHVMRDRRRPPFTYTVGLTPRGLPELLVTGLGQQRAAALLNTAAAHLVESHGETFTPGQVVPLRGGPTVEAVLMDEPTVHLLTAVELYGPGIRAHQLVYDDDRGQWPWQLGFRGTQPVLGRRAI